MELIYSCALTGGGLTMQIYCFDQETAKAITGYGCQHTALKRIADHLQNATLGVIYIAPGGKVGYHQAVGDQLFLVMQGSGWATSVDLQPQPVEAGQAALWRDGEWHEAGSDAGMIAVIIEADSMDHILMTE